MEYYIVTTRNCNMKCKYCIYGDAQPDPSTQVAPDAEGIARFIEQDSRGNEERPVIVFYGGEPLLAQEVIKDIIDRTSFMSPDFFMYTNGLLLDRVDAKITKNVSHVLVSCDGDRRAHDRQRHAGSYDRILGNVRQFRKTFSGSVVARITLTAGVSVFDAVRNILEEFDGVFWQHVSAKELEDTADIDRYRAEVCALVDYWIESLKHGKVLNIYPIQAIVKNLISGEGERGYRCGVGTSLRVISADGDVYLCDEMIKHHDGRIGGIASGIDAVCAVPDQTRNRCGGCEVRDLCGGRCLYSHKYYSAERVQQYCEKTKALINEVLGAREKIFYAMESNGLGLDQVVPYGARMCTEEIP